jgi:hypothetical protein
MSQQKNQNKKADKVILKYPNKKGLSIGENLVTEQAGLKFFAIGLVISFVVGLFIKSALSPSRVTEQVERAARHINNNLSVKFKEAQFSLSDGVFPRFSVVITNAEMQFTDSCAMKSVLFIDELRLPISIWGGLTGQSLIKRIEADQVALSLSGKIKECASKDIARSSSETNEKTPLVSLSTSEENKKYKDAITELSIKTLKVELQDFPQYPIELIDLNLKVASFEPRILQLRAKTHLLHDEQVGGYLSYANLFAEFKDESEPKIQTHIYGNWREGHYSIIANYAMSDQYLNIETDLKHIPLSQILSLMLKYNFIHKDLKSKQIWVSGIAQMASDISKIKNAPLEIRNFQVEGELGDISSGQINITSLDPLNYKPIKLEIKKLSLKNLLSFLNIDSATGIFGSLGFFTGQAELISEDSVHLLGEHKGLEFIFSNKGQVELQSIDNIRGEVRLNDNQWSIALDKIEPHGGLMLGYLGAKADRNFKEFNITTKIDNLVFSPPVQDLITNGGEIGRLEFHSDSKILNGKIVSLKGNLAIDKMSIEGMDLERINGNFTLSEGLINLNTKVQDLKVSSDSAGADVFKQVTPSQWWENEKLEILDFNGQFLWKDLTQFQWKNFQGKVGKSYRLTTEGSWNEKGQLKGSAQIRDGKGNKKYSLGGNREHPSFSIEKLGSIRENKR